MAMDRQQKQQSGTVVGVFEDRRRAEQAVRELESAGFRDDQIGFAARGDDGKSTSSIGREGEVTTDTGPGSGALSGALGGGVVGGILGALASLAIPGVGPVVAAGILGPMLGAAAAGAGIGAVGGGLLGGLVTTGVPEDEARYYDEEFQSGRTLVTVKAGDRANEARAIIQRYGGYDSQSRGTAGTSTSTTTTQRTETDRSRTTGQAAAGTTGARDVRTADSGTMRVPETEERLRVDKRETEQGEVQIRKSVESERVTVPVDLEREEVHVERRDVAERPIAPGERVEAFQEGTVRVPVRGEEAVVKKEAVVTGEVVVDKERTTDREQVSDTVRRTRVEVDRDVDHDKDPNVADRDRNLSERDRNVNINERERRRP